MQHNWDTIVTLCLELAAHVYRVSCKSLHKSQNAWHLHVNTPSSINASLLASVMGHAGILGALHLPCCILGHTKVISGALNSTVVLALEGRLVHGGNKKPSS